MLIEFLKPDFTFTDDRGGLTQLVREGYRQINVISSKEGVVRGGHYHALNREAFYVVSGQFRLDLSRNGERERHVLKAGDFFTIPPLVTHSFTYLAETLLVGLYDLGVELPDGSKDIIANEAQIAD